MSLSPSIFPFFCGGHQAVTAGSLKKGERGGEREAGGAAHHATCTQHAYQQPLTLFLANPHFTRHPYSFTKARWFHLFPSLPASSLWPHQRLPLHIRLSGRTGESGTFHDVKIRGYEALSHSDGHPTRGAGGPRADTKSVLEPTS